MDYSFRYKDYTEALYDALKEDAFYMTMEKSVEDLAYAKLAMWKYLDYSIMESEKYGEVLIPAEHNFDHEKRRTESITNVYRVFAIAFLQASGWP